MGFSGRLTALHDFVAGLTIAALPTVLIGATLPSLGAHHFFNMPDLADFTFVKAIMDAHDGTLKMLAYLVTHDEFYRAEGNSYTLFTAHPALPPRARAALGKAVADGYHEEEAQKEEVQVQREDQLVPRPWWVPHGAPPSARTIVEASAPVNHLLTAPFRENTFVTKLFAGGT